MKETVVVGMSGGVDSAVAAALLKERGFNVIGVFMHNWEEEADEKCTAQQDYQDVIATCSVLGIPYYTVNFAKQYLDKVFKHFLEEYEKGRTPNPDVLCNREIKFGPFIEFAKKLGADFIATGHYAGVESKDGLHYLTKAKDAQKDQTYFLNQLTQRQLSFVRFPLKDIIKPEVRTLAAELKLPIARKRDSTGVCFIGERKFKEFLSSYLPANPGEMRSLDGRLLGRHDGLMYYTIGQRRGLRIGGKGTGEPWFVIDKDLKNNVLLVAQGDDGMLYSKGLEASGFNFIPRMPAEKSFECKAKFRYRQPEQDVFVEIKDGSVNVAFKQNQRAVTCGQYVVLYKDEYCLGGGVIDKVIK
jgi:tRNA-specific 2-thiouridylase